MTWYSDLVVGVDAGGTKTTAWLARLDAAAHDAVRGRGTSGPGNPRAAGFDIAQRNIAAAVANAFADAKLEPGRVAAVCIAAAGAGRDAEQQRLKAWAADCKLAEQIHISGDVEPVLAAVSVAGTGIALISGTGSLAWGRNSSGETARAGGWGYLFGDEGSGYAIALAGLRAAAKAADGVGPHTTLLAALQHRLEATKPEELVNRVYEKPLTRAELASLADVVFESAGTDAVARQIVDEAAEDLARLVRRLKVSLRFDGDSFPLAVAGGVLTHQREFRADVARRSEITVANMQVVAEPVAGAVVLARAECNR